LVQENNTMAGEPLVIKRAGGAEFTPAGRAAVARFLALAKEFQPWLQERQA
jgi:molybdenum-dependent DNA-binding transcriptional regulator ModE